jgi:outer membrane cobalamin receptor
MQELQKLKTIISNIPQFKKRKNGTFGNNVEATLLTKEQLDAIKETYSLRDIKVNITGVGCSVYDEKMQNNPKETNTYRGMVLELYSVAYTLDDRLFFKGKIIN